MKQFAQHLLIVAMTLGWKSKLVSAAFTSGTSKAGTSRLLRKNRIFPVVYLSSESSSCAEKARVVFLGTPDVAATSLNRIIEKSKEEDSVFEVVGVVTQPPKRRKRKGNIYSYKKLSHSSHL